jgi:Flp pilus assembly protein TadD
MRQQFSPARLLASAALTVVLATGLGGCQTMSDITGSITPSSRSEPAPDADPRTAEQAYGDRYRANPKDADAALAYGQALRANGQRAQAAAVLEQATINNPGNKALLAAYGRALADNARRYYESALKIVPNEPSVLSNLGLSYMLTKDLPKAEQVLRQAYANPKADARVRQNLGLVVGLQGRFAEAETIVKADLPPDEAAANVAYLREMLKGSSDARASARSTVPFAEPNRPD